MTIIDISLSIDAEMLRYPTDPAFCLEKVQSLEKGDPASVSIYSLGSHTGTHVDPPNHFLADGGGLDSIPLDHLVGHCHVLEISGDWVTEDELRHKLPLGAKIILLRTRNSRLGWIRSRIFTDEYTALTLEGARFLVSQGVRSVGIDYLSIEKAQNSEAQSEFPVHKELLKSRVTILEGLDLTDVSVGEYLLCCLPLRIPGGDGGPARAVLIR